MSVAASPIARPSVGRTFTVAISLLGLIALAQLGALGWKFVHDFTSLTERAKVGPGANVAGVNPAASGNLASAQANGSLESADPFQQASISADGIDTPILPPSKPVPLSMQKLNPPPPPPENRFQELLQQGRQLRERGDTPAALVKFREAQTLDPQNPEAIADFAVTYERMAQMDRAGEQWRRIYEMGESAGPYYVAAEARLEMSKAQALAAVQIAQQNGISKDGPISSLRPDAILGIGTVTKSDRADSAGVRFALRVPIKGKRTERIAVGDVDIQVFFYDDVDGKSVVQTDADLSYRFVSSPVDWSGSEPETLEVEYSQQAQTAKATRPESRHFYGYIVRLYHKGELQDVRAEPSSLNEKFPAPPNLDPPAK